MIASGEKTIEVRTWATKHRGPVLICAGKGGAASPVSGMAVCISHLVDVRPLTQDDLPAAGMPNEEWFPEYSERYFAWILSPPMVIIPFPVRGMPGLFDIIYQGP